MNRRKAARLLLLLGCLLGLRATGCASGTPPRPTPGVPPGTGPTAVTPAPIVEPPAPRATKNTRDCRSDSGNRMCDVSVSEDGAAPVPHPCQDPRVGQCDTLNVGMCLFRWKADGELCNNGLGVCQGQRCRCTQPNACGYDCSTTCSLNQRCVNDLCVASTEGADGGGAAPQPCGGCAHRSANC